MTESYLTTNSKNGKPKSTKFTLFFSSILSQPLYFSYFILFSPYLIKLLSFLSPLFITTILLLTSLLYTVIHENAAQGKNLKDGFEKLLMSNVEDDLDQELVNIEELEVYKIIFGEDSELRSIEDGCFEENPVEKTYHVILERKTATLEVEEEELRGNEERSKGDQCEEMTTPIPISEKPDEDQQTTMETKTMGISYCEQGTSGSATESEGAENEQTGPNLEATEKQGKFLHEESECENLSAPIVGREQSSDLDSTSESRGPARAPSHVDSCGDSGYFEASGSPNLGKSCGSMRKEKEWRRTLACKLFEERHNTNGNKVVTEETGECMDLLWETYETDLDRTRRGIKVMNKESSWKKKDKKVETLQEYVKDDDDDGEEEDVEDENGQLCCLQALKFSAGKVNLGMRRPNLLKITKAFKGMGWLHQVTNKHSKKRVQPYK